MKSERCPKRCIFTDYTHIYIDRGYTNSQLSNSDTTTSKKGTTIGNSFSNYNNPDANSFL